MRHYRPYAEADDRRVRRPPRCLQCEYAPREAPHVHLSLCIKERDGWYTTHSLERIKTILRHKFFSLLDGYPATDEECAALLETQSGRERLASRHVPRPGKHNMAKGALRPEDAAVSSSSNRNAYAKRFKALRLRATLDRSIKNVPSQKQ